MFAGDDLPAMLLLVWRSGGFVSRGLEIAHQKAAPIWLPCYCQLFEAKSYRLSKREHLHIGQFAGEPVLR